MLVEGTRSFVSSSSEELSVKPVTKRRRRRRGGGLCQDNGDQGDTIEVLEESASGWWRGKNLR